MLKEKAKSLKGRVVKVLNIIFDCDEEYKCKHINECLFHRCDICRRNQNYPDYLTVSRRIIKKRRERDEAIKNK